MNKPYWVELADRPAFSALDDDLTVDCLVIGAGITGVTAAYLLGKEGVSTALVERDWIGAGDTSHTTAHLTYMTDTRLSKLVALHGKENARLAWQAGADAMELIRGTVEELGIDCDFACVPGYLAAAYDSDWEREKRDLQEEANCAREMGFDVRYIEDAPPENRRPAILFENQYQFHALKYLHALVREVEKLGVKIYEHTDVGAFGDQPLQVTANGHKIIFKHVVIATHVPLQGNTGTMSAALFQSKLASYSTYAISAIIPRGALPPMIWSDTDDPFLYLRISKGAEQDGGDLAILGGEDHKTGQEPHNGICYSHLEDTLDSLLPDAKIEHRWTGQVVETVDGLPYIGANEDGQFLATGFSGTGLTFGTAAAMMARDSILGRKNPYSELFCLHRKKLAAVGEYVKENVDFPVRMVTDRMGIPKTSPENLQRGCGKLIVHGGEKIAAYRDKNGELHELSAVCPHLGCIVAWNEAEKTWDCPCHGSRFAATGELLAGPAEKGLEAVTVMNH